MQDMLYNQVQDRSLLTDFALKKKSMKSVSIEYTDQTMDQKILSDYLAFFTTSEGADMLPYVYLESSKLYDNLVKNNHDYYLFRDEVSLIQKNKISLSHYLSDVINIIEIGPGSCHTMQHKTIPVLSCAAKLKTYQAIDHSENYLIDVCKFIRNQLPKIDVFSTEADLMQSIPIKLSKEVDGKKAIMLLGSTLENFTIAEQNYVIEQIVNLIDSGDIFILTVDTNQNEKLLLSAYANNHLYSLIGASLKYFSKINPNFAQYLNSFEATCVWNGELNFVDMYFVAKENISFHLKNYGNINIIKGQELRGIKSRKPSEQAVIDLLSKSGFDMVDMLVNSNKMKMFICKKR